MLASKFEKLAAGAGLTVRKACGLLLILAATCGTAYALPPVPEVDPGSASLAVALLASGFFLFTGSRRRT